MMTRRKKKRRDFVPLRGIKSLLFILPGGKH
jgi:hypothetical protein